MRRNRAVAFRGNRDIEQGPLAGLEPKGVTRVRMAFLGLALIAFGSEAARAQDIAGIEDCTRTSGLDKRTGCFQSNVNFLQRLVTKNELARGQRVKGEAARQ